MGLLQTRTERRLRDTGGEPRYLRFTVPSSYEDPDGRHEPHSLIERIVPRDPYAAWLEQRESDAEREREARPQIRLIHRPRGGEERGIVAHRL